MFAVADFTSYSQNCKSVVSHLTRKDDSDGLLDSAGRLSLICQFVRCFACCLVLWRVRICLIGRAELVSCPCFPAAFSEALSVDFSGFLLR